MRRHQPKPTADFVGVDSITGNRQSLSHRFHPLPRKNVRRGHSAASTTQLQTSIKEMIMTSPNESRLDALAYFAEIHNDPELAFRLVRLPAMSGDAASQWYLGYLLWKHDRDSKRTAQTACWFKKASDQGLAAAHASIGAMHSTGSLRRDAALAEQWRQKALLAVEPGQFICGERLTYENRLCLRRDYSRALKWYVSLAATGDAEACWLLGNIYHKGFYVKRSFVKAVNWYFDAAVHGHPEAGKSVRFLHDKHYGASPNYAEEMVVFHEQADHGDAVAQFILSLQYGQSFGFPRDGALSYMLAVLLAEQMPSPFDREIVRRVSEGIAHGLTKSEVDFARRMASEWLNKWKPVGSDRSEPSGPTAVSEAPRELLPELSD
jgi:TPR repeat protein